MITIQDLTPHHPATCIFCRNDALPEPHPDHIHTYDSDLGVTCKWDSVLEASVLVIQCECGHEREIEGIMHPEPFIRPNYETEKTFSSMYLNDVYPVKS